MERDDREGSPGNLGEEARNGRSEIGSGIGFPFFLDTHRIPPEELAASTEYIIYDRSNIAVLGINAEGETSENADR
jgi:hypothetical protein